MCMLLYRLQVMMMQQLISRIAVGVVSIVVLLDSLDSTTLVLYGIVH